MVGISRTIRSANGSSTVIAASTPNSAGVIKEAGQALADPAQPAHPGLQVEQGVDARERPLELRPSVGQIREVADDRVQQRDEHLGKLGRVW